MNWIAFLVWSIFSITTVIFMIIAIGARAKIKALRELMDIKDLWMGKLEEHNSKLSNQVYRKECENQKLKRENAQLSKIHNRGP